MEMKLTREAKRRHYVRLHVAIHRGWLAAWWLRFAFGGNRKRWYGMYRALRLSQKVPARVYA